MMNRPFVYFSEQLVTQRNHAEVIVKCARRHGYDPDAELVKEIWKQRTLSTKSQLRKYNILSSGYKQQALRNWYHHLSEQLLPGILGPNSSKTSDSALAQSITQCLTDPKSWHVPQDTHRFIEDLQANHILWGIIANDDHLYPLTLKFLGLKPFKVVSAAQNMFKPLPNIFEKAWRKVPSTSQHNVWFIGDSRAPYDNIHTKQMNTAILGNVLDKSSVSRWRIKCYDDLYQDLGIGPSNAELGEIDMGADELQEFLILPKNKILERGVRDKGLVDISDK